MSQEEVSAEGSSVKLGGQNMKLKLVLTKWLINHRASAGCPYIYIWGMGTMHLQGADFLLRESMELLEGWTLGPRSRVRL